MRSANVITHYAKPAVINLSIEVSDKAQLERCRSANVITHYAKPAVINLSIEVSDKAQLERCFSQLRQMSDVLNLRLLAQSEG